MLAKIPEYVAKTEGRAFVLFTSYTFLNRAAERLGSWFAQNGYSLLVQGSGSPANTVFLTALSIVAWAAWALLTYQIGVRLMPAPETRSDVGELLRTIGFSAAPGILRIFGIVPGAAIPAFGVTAVWMLLAMIVAVRQALDYKSTARAVAVCGLGWVLTIVIAVGLGLVFGPAVS